MAIAIATRRSGFAHDVAIGDHSLVSDEPPSSGGEDGGPSPTALLAASLASCTAITVEMYADRKGWELGSLSVSVDLEGSLVSGDAHYTVSIDLPEGLGAARVERILRIAAKCPVHKAIAGETPVSVQAAES